MSGSIKSWFVTVGMIAVVATAVGLVVGFVFPTNRGGISRQEYDMVIKAADEAIKKTDPSTTVKALNHINTPMDLVRYEDHFTPQGKDVYVWMMRGWQDRPATDEKSVFSKPIIRGGICDVTFRGSSSDTTGAIRLISGPPPYLRSVVWQIHDIYINKVNGQKVEEWASNLKDHPFQVWWSKFLGF